MPVTSLEVVRLVTENVRVAPNVHWRIPGVVDGDGHDERRREPRYIK
jgi:hypothetical protein